MYAYSRNSLNSAPWQATGPSIVWNIRDAIQLTTNASVISHQEVPKKLTPEALYMIFVLLVFATVTLISSLLDIWGYLRETPTREKPSEDIQKKTSTTNEVPCHEDGKESSGTSVLKKNCRQFLRCFSAVENGKSLLSTASDENLISCLDGIRVLCIYLILQIHIISFYINVIRNEDVVIYHIKTMILPKSFFGMTILLLSGICNGYSFSRQYRRSRGKISWLSLPLHTFIKFTPAHLIIVWFYTVLFPYIGSGPLWPKYDTNPVCQRYWIWNLLCLSNFLPHDKQCILQTWYLTCLIQLQIFSPLLLIPIMRMPKLGYSLTAFACVLWYLISFSLVIKYNLVEILMLMTKDNLHIHTVVENVWRYADIMHTRPYTRLNFYAIGIALGCYVYHQKLSNFKKYSMVKLSFGWITCLIFLCLCALNEVGFERHVYTIAALHSIKPLLFTCSMSWVIFLCASDQCGFLNKFLSCNLFKILSRLCFPAYLLHMFVLEKYFLSFEDFIDHSFVTLVLTSIYIHLWIIAVSFMFSLIIGIPVLRTSNLFIENYLKNWHQKKN